jgi:predicted RNA-binding protein with PUA-like domain
MPPYWLLKTEPARLPLETIREGAPVLHRGVRSPPSRTRLGQIRRGDEVLLQHTGRRPALLGTARVRRGAHPDPEGTEAGDVAVVLGPVRLFAAPLPLARLRAEPALAGLELLTFPRLSVVGISPHAFRRILRLAGRPA